MRPWRSAADDIESYGIKAVLRGPVGLGDGRNTWFDNWRRDIGIGCLVFWTMHRFGFNTYSRNREQRRRQQPRPAALLQSRSVAGVSTSAKSGWRTFMPVLRGQ